jgi:hypothetical protein
MRLHELYGVWQVDREGPAIERGVRSPYLTRASERGWSPGRRDPLRRR